MPKFAKLAAAVLATSLVISACDDGPPADAAEEKRNSYGAYLSALHADRRNQAAIAARGYLDALKANPENAGLRRKAFYASMRAGDLKTAIALARKIVTVEPAYMPANLALVTDAMKRGEHKEALGWADKLPTYGALSFVRAIARAWAMAGIGDGKKALEALDKLKERHGVAVFYTLHRGLLLDVLGRDKEAADFYRKAYKNQSSPAIRFIQAAAMTLARTGDKDGAVKMINSFEFSRGARYSMAHLRNAIGKDEASPALVKNASDGFAELLMNMASAMEQDGTTRPALMWAQASLYLRPESGASLYLTGDIQRDLEQHEDAIKTHGRVGTDDPFSWEAGKSIVSSLAALDRNAEAQKLLEEMAAREPKRWDVLAMLGNLHRRQKKWADAIKAYDGAIGRLGEPKEVHWNLFFARGVAFERAKIWPKAEKDFRTSLKLRPDQPAVLNYLAYSWVDRNENLQEALGMLRKAVSLRPRDGAIIDSLGWAYYRLGQFPRAVRILERAVTLSPRNWEINDHLGDAYWRTGRFTEARHQWRRALTMEPDKSVVAKIKAKLASGLPALKPSEPSQ
jgi:tetratricopeptide (TPR) repeat protein